MFRALAACVLLSMAPWPAVADPGDVDDANAPEASAPAEPTDAAAGAVRDPWEPFNRKIFAFNETLDRYALEPVAKAWDFVVPELVQKSITHFGENLMLPTRFLNDLLQLKFEQAYETFWRGLFNTTVGIGGLFDPASHFNMLKSDEDFGQTLGYWGASPGPYLVLPLLGPSNVRDATGRAVDSASRVYTWFIPLWASTALTGVTAIDLVNYRASQLETIRAERAQAFDWYAAVRSAYSQYRENRVHDRKDVPKEANDEDLYDVDE